ncbi:MAG: DUF922 domain-containing Zn-dependent protease [Proteobacteria bacterium]|nr:DUF922 domain-containing Zn-dependent protease [Pseudomonadota bacterium]
MTAALLLASMLQAASAANAGVETNLHVQTYAIGGSSADALWEQIHQRGPLFAKDGKRYAAYTHWNVHWHYDYWRDAGGCRIERASVTLEATQTFPEWVDRANASRWLQGRWDAFVVHLKQHEDGHLQHGRQAAQAIGHAIDSIGRAPECATLGKQIDAYAHYAIARAAHDDLQYDADTRYGQTQGAVLP